MDVIRRFDYRRICPTQIFGYLEYVGRDGAIDSLRNDRNTQIGLSDATVRVEATNSTATARYRSTAQS